MTIAEMTVAEVAPVKAATTKGILSALTALNGVNTAVCVGRDGFEIDSSGPVNTNIGAMVSSELGAVERIGEGFYVGTLSRVIMEYADGFVVVTSVGSDFILLVAAEENSNLRNVLMQVERQKRELETIL
jgi:predicted regulator of Ras-like GTPase activity (Roadblock/LC7/MglB family)